MDITTLLGTLVAVLTTVMTVDKFIHAFGLSKLLSAQVRHLADSAVERAKATPGTKDDEVAATFQALAHKAADAIDAGDESKALEALKDAAAARLAK